MVSNGFLADSMRRRCFSIGLISLISVLAALFMTQATVAGPVGGNSLEEVLGTDTQKLSDHFYRTWYDQLSPDCQNWVLVANHLQTGPSMPRSCH